MGLCLVTHDPNQLKFASDLFRPNLGLSQNSGSPILVSSRLSVSHLLVTGSLPGLGPRNWRECLPKLTTEDKGKATRLHSQARWGGGAPRGLHRDGSQWSRLKHLRLPLHAKCIFVGTSGTKALWLVPRVKVSMIPPSHNFCKFQVVDALDVFHGSFLPQCSRTASTRSPMCCRSSWVGRRIWPPRSLAYGCSSANSCPAVLACGSRILFQLLRVGSLLQLINPKGVAKGSKRLFSVTRFPFLFQFILTETKPGNSWGFQEQPGFVSLLKVGSLFKPIHQKGFFSSQQLWGFPGT